MNRFFLAIVSLLISCNITAQMLDPSFVEFLYNKKYPLDRLDTLTRQEQFFYMQFAASHPNDTASAQLRNLIQGHVNVLNEASMTMSQRPILSNEIIWPLTQQNDTINFDFLLQLPTSENFLIEYLGRCVRTPRQANQYAEMGAHIVDPFDLQLWYEGAFYLIRNGHFSQKIQETLIQQFELWNNVTKNQLIHFRSSYWKAIARIPKSKFDKNTWSTLLLRLPLQPQHFPPNKYFVQVLGKCNQPVFNQLLLEWSKDINLKKELRLECLIQLQRNNFKDCTPLLSLVQEQDNVLGSWAIQLCANAFAYDSIPMPFAWDNPAFKTTHPDMYAQFSVWRLKTTHFDPKGKKTWQLFLAEKDEYHRLRALERLALRKDCLPHLVDYLTSSKASYTDLYYGTEMLISAHTELENSHFWKSQATRLWETMDVGVQALLATAIKEAKLSDELLTFWFALLEKRLPSLILPKEVETYNEIVMALNSMTKFSNKKFQPFQPQPVVQIDPDQWQKLKSNRRYEMMVIAQGVEQKIIFDVHELQHPITAMHFQKLVNNGFYDNKQIHRYVPNFVSQGGCPRGDGMGGLDEVIPSEFTLDSFDAGCIGWASAGPHTESCQIFFMTSDAPHLDGRYTNMGQVIKGMEFLPEMTIGTTINSIKEVK